MALLPFRNPMDIATLNFGGIEMYVWMCGLASHALPQVQGPLADTNREEFLQFSRDVFPKRSFADISAR